MANIARLANQLTNRGSSGSKAWAEALSGTGDVLGALSDLVITKPVGVSAATTPSSTTSSNSSSTSTGMDNGGSSKGGTPSGVGKATKASAGQVGKISSAMQILGVLTGQPELAFAGKAIGTAVKAGTSLESGNAIKAVAAGAGLFNPTVGALNTIDSAVQWAGTKINESELEKQGKKAITDKNVTTTRDGDVRYSAGMWDTLSALAGSPVTVADGLQLSKNVDGNLSLNWTPKALADTAVAAPIESRNDKSSPLTSQTLSPGVLSDLLGVSPLNDPSAGRVDSDDNNRSDGYSGSTSRGESPSWGNAQNERGSSTSSSSDNDSDKGGRDGSGSGSDMGGPA